MFSELFTASNLYTPASERAGGGIQIPDFSEEYLNIYNLKFITEQKWVFATIGAREVGWFCTKNPAIQRKKVNCTDSIWVARSISIGGCHQDTLNPLQGKKHMKSLPP